MARQYGIRSRINQPSSLTEIQVTELDMNTFITDNFNSTIFQNWVNNYLLGSPPADGEVLGWDSATNKWFSYDPRIYSMECVRVPGRYYSSNKINSGLETQKNVVSNHGLAMPFIVPCWQSFDRLAAFLTIGGNVGTKVRIGIYKNNDEGYPGELLLDSGELEAETQALKEVNIDVLLKGLYWLVVNGFSAAGGGDPHFKATDRYRNLSVLGWPQPVMATTWQGSFYEKDPMNFAPLPDPFPAGADKKIDTKMLNIFLRKKNAIP